jgi:hypothetical protein
LEFERQVERLVELDFPAAAGLSEGEFVALVAPLETRLDDVPPASGGTNLSLVIVMTRALVPAEVAMSRIVNHAGRSGVVNMTPVGPADFAPRAGTVLPESPVYLLVDVDTGADTLNVTPQDALPRIESVGRLPLTIDEGVALLTQFPDVLRSHNAFQLLASRRADKRIPSIWASAGRPRLGWCWAGNPHSWLGSASAASRLA